MKNLLLAAALMIPGVSFAQQPRQRLDIDAQGKVQLTFGSNTSYIGQISNTPNKALWSFGFGTALDTLGTRVITMSTNGYVGINSAAPSYRLDVKDLAGTGYNAVFTSSGSDSQCCIAIQQMNAANGASYNLLDSTGTEVGFFQWNGAASSFGTPQAAILGTEIYNAPVILAPGNVEMLRVMAEGVLIGTTEQHADITLALDDGFGSDGGAPAGVEIRAPLGYNGNLLTLYQVGIATAAVMYLETGGTFDIGNSVSDHAIQITPSANVNISTHLQVNTNSSTYPSNFAGGTGTLFAVGVDSGAVISTGTLVLGAAGSHAGAALCVLNAAGKLGYCTGAAGVCTTCNPL